MPSHYEQMLNDPRLQMLAAQRNQPNVMQAMRKPANPLAALAKAYPQLKAQAEQLKLEEQKRKVKKMEFDQLLKRAEQAYKMQEQQQQMAQGQAQIQQARQSV